MGPLGLLRCGGGGGRSTEGGSGGVGGWLWRSVWCTCARFSCYGAKTTLGLRPAPTASELPLETSATCSCFSSCSFGADSFTCRGIHPTTTRENWLLSFCLTESHFSHLKANAGCGNCFSSSQSRSTCFLTWLSKFDSWTFLCLNWQKVTTAKRQQPAWHLLARFIE